MLTDAAFSFLRFFTSVPYQLRVVNVPIPSEGEIVEIAKVKDLLQVVKLYTILLCFYANFSWHGIRGS